jgi:hypothetical protein
MNKLKYLLLFILCSHQLWAQPYSVNSLRWDSSLAQLPEYTFIISGHFYGDGFNKTHYPANTILGNIELLNSVDFTLCLGDLYRDVRYDHTFYKKHFYSQLKKPLLNAVGNHDISGSFYQDFIAPTFYRFKTLGVHHIVLDTELDDSSIEGEQLNSLKAGINAFNESTASYLMIYSHRPIWAEEDSVLQRVFSDNTQSDFGSNFQTDVEPLLQQINSGKQVYWFSGSMGAQPYAFFYQKREHIHYAITAIRGADKDAVLLAHYKDGSLNFQTHSLTGQKLLAFEDYTVDKFTTYEAPLEINYRLIPLWVKNTIFHRYFWYGVLVGLLVIFVVMNLKSKLKR